MQRLKDFIGRRLSPEEDFGLYLTAGMLLSLCLLSVFVAVGHAVESEQTQFDEAVGLRLTQHREENSRLRRLVLFITDFGSFPILTGLAVGGALLLVAARRPLLAIVWLLAPAGGGLLDAALKHFYERDRPSFKDASVPETNLSFPSGHALASVVGYGLLAYVLVRFLPRRWMKFTAVSFLAILVLAIDFSRVYLGAHYLTDVIGGLAIGACWLAACISAVEALRRKRSTLARVRASLRAGQE
jgi:membrane-associated phospholipid phosphatase